MGRGIAIVGAGIGMVVALLLSGSMGPAWANVPWPAALVIGFFAGPILLGLLLWLLLMLFMLLLGLRRLLSLTFSPAVRDANRAWRELKRGQGDEFERAWKTLGCDHSLGRDPGLRETWLQYDRHLPFSGWMMKEWLLDKQVQGVSADVWLRAEVVAAQEGRLREWWEARPDVSEARTVFESSAPHGGSRARLVIAAAGIVALAILVVALLAGAPIPLLSNSRDSAENAAVKDGIHSIQGGVESWAAAHGSVCPTGEDVSSYGLATYIDSWPTNPYTNVPMTQGTDRGDFCYSTDGSSYRLTGYGDDGKAIIAVP